MKILLADDSTTMRRIIANMLNSMGYNDIAQADCGEDAVAAVQADPDIGLVLLDWNMPLMNGMQCLKTLKSNPDTAKIPVIMVTSEATDSKIAEAIKIGASGYLVKPFDISVLKKEIEKIKEVL